MPAQRTRRFGPRLALLVWLETFQRLGYFVPLSNVPAPIVARVASAAGLAGGADELASYDGSSYRTRLMTLVGEPLRASRATTARLGPSRSRRALRRRAPAMISLTS